MDRLAWGMGSIMAALAFAGCSSDDSTAEPGTGGKPGSGGSRATGGKTGTGGSDQTGGRDNTGGSSTGGKPDAPDGEAPSCGDCTRDLSASFSLDCYCAGHSCSRSLSASAALPKWQYAQQGCGYTVFYFTFGAGDGSSEIFETATGKLVGANTWTDVSGGQCRSPKADAFGNSGGGLYADGYDGLYPLCHTASACRFRVSPSSEGGAPIQDASAPPPHSDGGDAGDGGAGIIGLPMRWCDGVTVDAG